MVLAEDVREWVCSQWDPVIMVQASPEVDAMCMESNGMSFVELLRPFGTIRELNGAAGVPIRTVAEQSVRLHSWRLRFFAGWEMSQHPLEVCDAHLRTVLDKAVEEAAAGSRALRAQSSWASEGARGAEGEALEASDLGSDAGSENEAEDDSARPSSPRQPSPARVGSGPDPTPWFASYRDEFLRLMQFTVHEARDFPVASVLALPSTTAGDLAQAFEMVHLQSARPPLLQAGVMDARMPRHYLLVHDARQGLGSIQRLEKAVADLQARVGAPAQLLVLNSREDGGPAGREACFWARSVFPRLGDGDGRVGGVRGLGGRGASIAALNLMDADLVDGGHVSAASNPPHCWGRSLSPQDAQRLETWARDMALRFVIPLVETRIRALNQAVAAGRKGLRNQLRSLLWRRTGAAGGPGETGADHFLSSRGGAAGLGGLGGSGAGLGVLESQAVLRSGGGSQGEQGAGNLPSLARLSGSSAGGGEGVPWAALEALPRAIPSGPAPDPQAFLLSALPTYAAGTLPAEMRLLADLALAVRDPFTAASSLRLAAADFRGDRAALHYAGALEALGVASALGGAPWAEVLGYLKEAFYRYSQLGVKEPAGGARAAASQSGLEGSLDALARDSRGLAPGPLGGGTASSGPLGGGATTGHFVGASPGPPPPPAHPPPAALLAAQGVRLATRCALLLAALALGAGQPLDAAWAFTKAHYQEEGVRAGLLLEQASLALRRARPRPRARKAAFHAVLAALRFAAAGQPALAARSCRAAEAAYGPRRWRAVELHLADAALRRRRARGDAAGALQAALRAARASAGGPAGAQKLALAALGEAASASRAAREAEKAGREAGTGGGAADAEAIPASPCEPWVPRLSLPELRGRPRLRLADPALAPRGSALHLPSAPAAEAPDGVPERAWRALERAARRSARALNGGASGPLEELLKGGAHVGEALEVDVELFNPLDVELVVVDLALECQDLEDLESGAGPPCDVLSTSIAVQGMESVVVTLRATPLRPGLLALRGLRWALDGLVRGGAAFPRQPGKGLRAKGSAAGPRPAAGSAAGALVVRVHPALPRLDVSVRRLPPSLLAGEVARCALAVSNGGAREVRGLVLAAGPGCVLAGPELGGDEDGGGGRRGDEVACASQTAEVTSASQASEAVSAWQSASAQHHPWALALPAFSLARGETRELELAVRCTSAGPALLPLLLVCGAGEDPGRLRATRATVAAQVLPCLRVRAALLASAAAPGVRMLQLAAHSLRRLQAVTLEGLAVADPGSRLEEPGGDRASLLAPEARALLHRRVMTVGEGEAGEEEGERDAWNASLFGPSPPPQLILDHLAGDAVHGCAPAAVRALWRRQADVLEARAAAPDAGLALAVAWSAPGGGGDGRTRRGFSVVRALPREVRAGDGAAAATPAAAEAATSPCPLQLQLRGPGTNLRAPASAPLVLRLANAGSRPLRVQVQTEAVMEEGRVARGRGGKSWTQEPGEWAGLLAPGPRPGGGHVWEGATTLTLDLAPGGQTECALGVALMRPGMHAIADYVVSWAGDDARGVCQGPVLVLHALPETPMDCSATDPCPCL